MWDQRYNEEGFAYGTEPNDFLKNECSRFPKAGRILCLAEGEGRNAVFLAKLGFSVTAVDQSAVGLRKARTLAADNGVRISTETADLADYDLGRDSWDGIVSIAAHLPPELRRRVHRQVVDALKPGGLFLLEAYTERHLEMPGTGGPPPSQRELFMSLADLTSELAGLETLIARETERCLSEGKFHQGESAVVQFLARKGDGSPD